MNKLFLLILFFLASQICTAQNLVFNGDFEQFSSCPSYVGQIDSALFWTTPSQGSPDYFNQCTNDPDISVPNNYWGSQMPHSGQGYAGLNLIYYSLPDFREYIEGQFTIPLKANSCYFFQMYLNKADNSQCATDAIGVYFSDTLVSGITNLGPLNFSPQITNQSGNFISDTVNWNLFSAIYTAHGGEKYFLIGNFKNDSNTDTIFTNSAGNQTNGYVYVDDVSVVTIICTGINEQDENYLINLYPNPFDNKINIQVNSNDALEIILYNITSQKILQTSFRGPIILNTDALEKGIYFYEIRNKSGVIKKGKVVKE